MTWRWQGYSEYATGGSLDPAGLRQWATRHGLVHWRTLGDWLDLRWQRAPGQMRLQAESWVDDRWFPDAALNMVDTLLAPAPAPALSWADEQGGCCEWSRPQLRRLTDNATAALAGAGVRPGSTVGMLMPCQPGAIPALLATLKLGATLAPLFTGYADRALAARIQTIRPDAWVTAATTTRKGHTLRPAEQLARLGATRVIVDPCHLPAAPPIPAAPTPAGTPALALSTSGSTGEPKSVVHGHAGWLLKVAGEHALHFDVGPGDRVCWITEPGWVMWAWTVTGALARGATVCMLEGHPSADRVWSFCAEHAVTHLGVSPSLARALRRHDPTPAARYDLTKLRVIGCTGEPLPGDIDEWLRNAAGTSLPVANITGGTEIGTLILAPLTGEPRRPGSVGQPSPGMPATLDQGELCLTDSWPSLPVRLGGGRTLRDEYVDGRGLWRHGDAATILEDQWFLTGRVDATLNIHGQRINAEEIERAVLADARILEAAAVEHDADLYVWVHAPGVDHKKASEIAREQIELHLGAPYRPTMTIAGGLLPRTPSGKLARGRLVPFVPLEP